MAGDPQVYLAILGMALVTYLTRISGFWLMGRFSPSPRLEAFLRHIPGAVLISIIAPAALTKGAADLLAALVTGLVAWRSKNLLLAMVAGVVAVVLLRLVF